MTKKNLKSIEIVKNRYYQILQLISRSLFCLLFILINGCVFQTDKKEPLYHYLPPKYDHVKINETSDTTHFVLEADMYNQIESSSLFSYGSKQYVSFYDETSLSLGIFEFDNQHLVKRIHLKYLFPDINFYKVSAYVINFDSIFISNKRKIYLIDSSGIVNKVIENRSSKLLEFDNSRPPVIVDNKLYTSVRMAVRETSLNKIKTWRVLYEYDLVKNSGTLKFMLPYYYNYDYYGRRLMQQYSCLNRDGRLVVSFAADSLLYETDLSSYNRAYFAKSKFQDYPIPPIKKDDLLNDQGYKQSQLRDAYGPIYYDRYNNRYLRIFKRKLTVKDFELKKTIREQSIIVMNHKFQIVGENLISGGIDANSLMIDEKGNIFARVKTGDEYAIHLVRLDERQIDQSNQLVKQ